MRPHAEPLPAELAHALDRVRPRLGPLGAPVMFFSSIGSTNDVAAALAASGDAEGAVVVADAQSAGRGRRGRTWFSPPGSGLYVSVVLAPWRAREAADRATALLTIAAGVALAEAVERVSGLRAAIKWPNDLLVGRRKLAGILAEGVARSTPGAGLQSVVLGYGVNVGLSAYPPELSDRVTSLESELGKPIDRAALFAESLASMAARYDDLLAGRFDAILDAWRALAPGSRSARVSWATPSGPQSGTTAGIDETGALLVRVPGGDGGDGGGDVRDGRDGQIVRLVAGEVHWV